MSYATYDQLVTRFGEQKLLGLLHTGRDAPPEADVEYTERLEAASAFIDSFLSAGGYETPVDTAALVTASTITQAAATRLDAQLAYAACLVAYIESSASGTEATKSVKDAYDRLMDWLRLIASGAVVLYSISAPESAFDAIEWEDSVLTDDLYVAAKAYLGDD